VEFIENGEGPFVEAESGASLASVSKRTIDRGWSGLEWGSAVPGTIGGAIAGNAGAHGSDTSKVLLMAEILQHELGIQDWLVEDFDYGYRDSRLKRNPGSAVVLSASFGLEKSTVDQTRAAAEEILAYRQRTQPSGASWGSMFKNPEGDFAGRLIEQAGLKGTQMGSVQISPTHANFFLNLGQATAQEVWEMIQHVRDRVQESSGIRLELEIELLGDWTSLQAVSEQGAVQGGRG
jgi:UDP-N-acetylmuramate dehydrogenase